MISGTSHNMEKSRFCVDPGFVERQLIHLGLGKAIKTSWLEEDTHQQERKRKGDKEKESNRNQTIKKAKLELLL